MMISEYLIKGITVLVTVYSVTIPRPLDELPNLATPWRTQQTILSVHCIFPDNYFMHNSFAMTVFLIVWTSVGTFPSRRKHCSSSQFSLLSNWSWITPHTFPIQSILNKDRIFLSILKRCFFSRYEVHIHVITWIPSFSHSDHLR